MKRHMIIVIITFLVCFFKWGITEAHWVPTLSGWAYHSLGCAVAIKATGHPDNPGLLRCIAQVSEWEVVCLNPANNGLFPGAAFSQSVTVGGQGSIDEEVSGKNKGRVHGEALVNLEELFDSQFCINPLWEVIDVLARRYEHLIEVHECTDAECQNTIKTAIVTGECQLEENFTVENYPNNLPDPGHPIPCTYNTTHIE